MGRRFTISLLIMILYYAVTFGKATNWKFLLVQIIVACLDAMFFATAANISYQVIKELWC